MSTDKPPRLTLSELERQIFTELHKCVCGYFTKSKSSMKIHLGRPHLKKEFDCEKGAPEPFSCPFCPCKTLLRTHLKQHIQYHHHRSIENREFVLRTYKCPDCSFETCSTFIWVKFHRFKCLKTEEAKNTMKPKVARKSPSWNSWHHCPTCSFKSLWYRDLRDHLKGKKINSHISWYYCMKCLFKTRNYEDKKKHDSGCDGRDKKPQHLKRWYHCSNCPKGSQCETCHLKTTMESNTPTNLKPISQKQLESNTPTTLKLIRQKPLKSNTLTNLTPKRQKTPDSELKCEKCHFVAVKPDHLKIHLEAHGDDYQCDKCDYKTNVPGFLKKHMVSHEQWLRCDQCIFRTKSKNDLIGHYVAEHDVRLAEYVKCDRCRFVGDSASALEEHVKMEHVKLVQPVFLRSMRGVRWELRDHCEYTKKEGDGDAFVHNMYL